MFDAYRIKNDLRSACTELRAVTMQAQSSVYAHGDRCAPRELLLELRESSGATIGERLPDEALHVRSDLQEDYFTCLATSAVI